MKKTWLFLIIVPCLLFNGCSNTSNTSVNEEGKAALAKINNDKKTNTANIANQTSISTSNGITYYFSRQTANVDKELINAINSSKHTLDIAIYSLTKKSIVDSIISAKKRGVEVEIITDKVQSGGKTENAQLKLLKNNKIPIKINSHSGLMHLKMTVADDVVSTGSYDYSDNSTNFNDEMIVMIKDAATANTWKTEFQKMWNDTKNYKNY